MTKHWSGLRLPAFLVLGILTLLACDPDEGSNSLVENSFPQTHVSLGFFRADSPSPDTLDQSTARIGMSWWGEDRDGSVTGYWIRWDYDVDSTGAANWTWTEAESDTFIVRLTSQEDTFSFQVKAMDDMGDVDPSPAVVVLPVRNSTPELEWTPNSQELLSNFFAGDTSWTFPHQTFRYNAWDLDGNQTIEEVLWALDDSTTWTVLDSVSRSLGKLSLGPELLTSGSHRLFIKARDVAHSWSNVLSYPAGESDTSIYGNERVWMVREAAGEILVIFDEPVSSLSRQSGVISAIESLGLQENVGYSKWVVNSNEYDWLADVDHTSYYWLPGEDLDVLHIFQDFKMVFWISYRDTRLLEVCPPLGQYLADGGKVLMVSTDLGYYDSGAELAIADEGLCMPVDSLSHARHFIFPLPGRDHPILPTAGYSTIYPEMHTSRRVSFQGSGISDLDFGFHPDETAEELYYVPEDYTDPESFPRATLGCRVAADHDQNRARLVYMAMPLYWMDNLEVFFQALIEEEFNW